jgi:RHS repeat-associated protein
MQQFTTRTSHSGLEPTHASYYRARYYDPGAGRFLAEDPLGFGGGDLNFYGYVSNGPTVKVDPSGRHIICPFTNPNCIQQQHLSGCAKKVLQPYFPGLNLDNVVLSPQLPGFATLAPGFEPDAITVGNTISYNPGTFSGDPIGLSLIGHELTHVQQQSSGFLPFLNNYLRDYLKNLANGMGTFDAYRNIGAERAAQAMGNRIFDDLFRKNGGGNICKEFVCK